MTCKIMGFWHLGACMLDSVSQIRLPSHSRAYFKERCTHQYCHIYLCIAEHAFEPLFPQLAVNPLKSNPLKFGLHHRNSYPTCIVSSLASSPCRPPPLWPTNPLSLKCPETEIHTNQPLPRLLTEVGVVL